MQGISGLRTGQLSMSKAFEASMTVSSFVGEDTKQGNHEHSVDKRARRSAVGALLQTLPRRHEQLGSQQGQRLDRTTLSGGAGLAACRSKGCRCSAHRSGRAARAKSRFRQACAEDSSSWPGYLQLFPGIKKTGFWAVGTVS